MLPYLDPKKLSAVIVAKRGKPDLHDTKSEMEAPESEQSDYDAALESAAEDMLTAIDERSVKKLAMALKAAHELCESEEEQDEPEPDYDGAA